MAAATAAIVRHRSGVCKKFVRTQAAHTARAGQKNRASESHVIGNDTRAGDLLAENYGESLLPLLPKGGEGRGEEFLISNIESIKKAASKEPDVTAGIRRPFLGVIFFKRLDKPQYGFTK